MPSSAWILVIIIVGVSIYLINHVIETREAKNQGAGINKAAPSITTPISNLDLVQRIKTYFKSTDYTITTQSNNSIVLQGNKDINSVSFALFFLMLGVGAFIYYIAAKTHQVIVIWENGDGFLSVSATGNTDKAQEEASNFLSSLPVGIAPN